MPKTTQAKKQGINPWMLSTIFLLAVLVLMIFENGKITNKIRSGGTTDILTAEKAGQEWIGFINEVNPATKEKLKISEIKEESGVYAATVSYDNQGQVSTSTIHISRDGKMFFQQGVDMEKEMQKMAEAASQNVPEQKDIPKSDKPKIEMFTMSYCPFGKQAEDGLLPVARLLGDNVEIEPHYVIYSDYATKMKSRMSEEQAKNVKVEDYCYDKEEKYCSMHGIVELKQNIRELCIYKYNKDKFWDYTEAVNKECTLANNETCWSGPAKKLGIDITKISNCLDNEIEDFLAAEVELNKKYNVAGSPTIIINGVDYVGGRSSDEYKSSVCNAFNSQPSECSETLSQNSAGATGGCEI
ncbi:MAG: thioredoxin domain-containing protein [Patescibacteria group bacterium]|nr:thioredoxin domain-containing protein [Patescibacteria group bacterium]